MNIKNLLILSFVLLSFSLHAQMWNGQDTLYGNEWINYDQSYFKIPVAKDGIYRVSYATLNSNNIPLTSINANQFQIFHLGEEIPLYVSTSNTIGNGDYIEFYGQKNTSEVDRYLFQNPDEEMLNPYYSMFTDTSAYFLTWSESEEGLRYEEIENDLTDLPVKEEWFWHEERLVLKNRQIQQTFTDGISHSFFDKGEGFASNQSGSLDFNLSTNNIHTQTNENAQYHIRLVTSTGATHELSLKINDDVVVNEYLSSYEQKDFYLDRTLSNLQPTENISITGGVVPNDRYAVAFISLRYPHEFTFNSTTYAAFNLNSSIGSQYIEIEEFSNAGENVLYNTTNQYRILFTTQDNTLKVKLPSSENSQSLVLINTQSGWQEANLLSVDFIDYSQNNADYIIISNQLLYDDGEGNNWVQAYADYRSSTDGGSYNVVLAEIQQLYDQFAYGVNRHPLSIRNFGHFAKKNWDESRYMLLIGKAREYNAIRNNNNNILSNFFVPTFGKPGADNLLLASTTSYVPALAIGRIPASSPKDVMYYLNKIKSLESSLFTTDDEGRAWRKEVIHLGGGGSASEQNGLKNHLIQMANIIESSNYGANVFAFYKTSSEPVQLSQSDQILDRINAGAGVITFFGHSSAGGFDFSIDDPSTYQNTNKYPVMFSLGCLSGQIHGNFKSVGENFVFQKDKGAIVFIASTGLGFINALDEFADKAYSLIGDEMYEKGIGEIIKASILHFEDKQGLAIPTLMQQITLNGDPAVNINPYKRPDYKFDVESVTFSPKIIDAQIDSFNIQFAIENIGKVVPDSFYLEIRRQFPDLSEALILRKKIPSPYYKETFNFNFPVLGTRAIGANKFLFRLDSDNEIEEAPTPFAENNNTLVNSLGEEGIDLHIFANRISTISPINFGIAGESDLTLKATTANPFATSADYVFQIDTSDLFTSPILQTHSVHSDGGLLAWTPSVTWQDSTVYYWRVSKEISQGQEYIWSTSSFIYLSNIEHGWNQSHYGQFAQDALTNLEINEENNELKYLDDVKFIRITNGVFPAVWPTINFNNIPFGYIAWNESTNGGIYISVMDPVTVDYWGNNPPGLYGSRLSNSWAYGWGNFGFSTQTQEQREVVLNFLQDTIPSGHYVAIYTIQHENQNYEPEEWALDSMTLGTNLFQFLEEQGATKIRNTASTGAKPYVFVFKKDDTSFPATEVIADLLEPIDVDISIPGIWNSGSILSTQIGPASTWEKLLWESDEIEPLDEEKMQLFGVRADASQSLLFDNIIARDTSLTSISAEEFPYLKLKYSTIDTLNRSTPQLKHWRILNQGLPEAVINKNDHFVFPKDTVQQGERLLLEYAIRNISVYNMDSVLVKYFITDIDNRIIQKEQRYEPLLSNDLIMPTLSLNTDELSGVYQLMVEVNPNNDQPEQNHQNNIALLDFFVEKDKKNPLIDVLFDNERILNGDIISSKPHIHISLIDENPYFALSDTSLFKILIKKLGESDVNAVYFSSGYLEFTPADEGLLSEQNKAIIEFDPEFTENGIYELIIQGEDVTGNQSGRIDYKITFEIITRTSISNLLNYPNPFTNSTRFVYTLTGEKPPPYFSIQIMTVSGVIVKRLTADDLGPLRPGTHQTDYAWDGTDEYGDKLANGVYIYKVTMKDENGQAIDTYKREAIDGFFDKGYGKLVILR